MGLPHQSSPTQINNWLFAKYNIYKNMALLSKRYSRLLLKNLIGLISYINTLNIRIDPRGSIYLFRKICSLIFKSITNMLNQTNAIERPWAEKHFKPIFDIWEGV